MAIAEARLPVHERRFQVRALSGAPAAPPPVAVLARAPEPGAVKTRLAAAIGHPEALAVYTALLACTARALRTWPAATTIHFSGAPAALAASPLGEFPRLPQGDGPLARRLHAALCDGLASGVGAIAIGSDCPGLRGHHLHALACLLGGHRVAFGPAGDGGYWGIAVRDAEALAICCADDLPWSRPTLLRETLGRLAARGISAGCAAQLDDVDEVADLERARLAGALPPRSPTLSIVVPVRDDARALAGCLDNLRRCAAPAEVVVVDGGSSDATCAIARDHPLKPVVLTASGGRHRQFAAAFAAARGDYVLCLPAGARLPAGGVPALVAWLARVRPLAGCLRRRAATSSPFHRWLDAWADLRAGRTHGAYMDQGPFFLRAAALASGFAAVGLYDTADLGHRLTGSGGFAIAPVRLAVSCRAYTAHGAWAVTLRHQRLRIRHHFRDRRPSALPAPVPPSP